MQTNFILYRNNYTIDQQKFDSVVRDISQDKRCQLSSMYYSSFFIDDVMQRPEVVFVDDMMRWCLDGLKSMSLVDRAGYRDRVGFNIFHWCQVYHGNHEEHDHFNAGTFISWVYFARPTKQKCFYFVIDGEKYYPQQDEGDFIMFPPYALHGIDECHEDETRVTMAGNLMWEEYFHAPDIEQTVTTVRNNLFVSEVFQK